MNILITVIEDKIIFVSHGLDSTSKPMPSVRMIYDLAL